MFAQLVPISSIRRLALLSLAVVAAAALTPLPRALAQSLDNIQTQLDLLKTPLILTPQFDAREDIPDAVAALYARGETRGTGWPSACWTPKEVLAYLLKKDYKSIPSEAQTRIKAIINIAGHKSATEVLNNLFELFRYYGIRHPEQLPDKRQEGYAALTQPLSFCKDSQRSTYKLIGPFNPSIESNVLKSDQNIHSGSSVNFGGTLQAFLPGARPYDLVGVSIQSTSARYSNYTSKSADSLMVQGAYQFFVNAWGYQYDASKRDASGNFVTINEETIDDKLKARMPAPNLITVETVTFGLLNQTAFLPPFLSDKFNLLTPQISYNIQNIPLAIFAGGDSNNVCQQSLPDFKKNGFCYYADVSITAGDTFSALATQANRNLQVSATLGKRLDQTDWKLAFQTVVTGRDYAKVLGGRDDVTLQFGPTISYTPPALASSSMGDISASLSVPAPFFDNYSSVAKNNWHGTIVLPTLTLTFEPPKKIE